MMLDEIWKVAKDLVSALVGRRLRVPRLSPFRWILVVCLAFIITMFVLFLFRTSCGLYNECHNSVNRKRIAEKANALQIPSDISKHGPYEFNKIHIHPDKLPKKLLFLVVVTSSAADKKGRDLRNAIRKTWGNCRGIELTEELIGAKLLSSLEHPSGTEGLSQYYHCRVVFNVGVTNKSELDNQIKEEASEHGDMVVSDVIEHYRNVTLKLRSCLHALSDIDAKYIVKADNDVFVNLPKLAEYLVADVNLPKTLYGGTTYTAKIIRDPSHRHFVSLEDNADLHYPLYCKGSMIVMSGHALKPLVEGFLHVKPFNIDDAYLGIVLNKLGVTPVRIKRIVQFQHLPVMLPYLQLCDFSWLIGIGDSLLPSDMFKIQEMMHVSKRIPSWMCWHFNLLGSLSVFILVAVLIILMMKWTHSTKR